MVIEAYALTSNAREDEVEWFYGDLQDLLEITCKKDVLFIIGDWNAVKKSRITWSNRQIWPWSTEWSRSKAKRVCQENALVIVNTLFQQHKRWLYIWTSPDGQDLDNHDGVITHLEPGVLECEVKWALRSITTYKASGGDGISVELFQILKDDAVKVLHSICQQIWKSQQWPQDWKCQFSFQSQRRASQRMLKLLHNHTHFTC